LSSNDHPIKTYNLSYTIINRGQPREHWLEEYFREQAYGTQTLNAHGE
jgi:hypothetical protein